jgi:hypothetical protein
VTMATPHESDSLSGSYKPTGSGNAENSIGSHLRSPGKPGPGLHRPECRVYQRSSVATRQEGSGPAGTRADCGPPSRR